MSSRSWTIFRISRAVIFCLSLLFSIASTVVLVWILSREFKTYNVPQRLVVVGSIINGVASVIFSSSMLTTQFGIRSDAKLLACFFVSALGNTVAFAIFGPHLPCRKLGTTCKPLTNFILFGGCGLVALALCYTLFLSFVILDPKSCHQIEISTSTLEKSPASITALEKATIATEGPTPHRAHNIYKASRIVAGIIQAKLRPERANRRDRPISSTSSWEVPFRSIYSPSPASPASSYRKLRTPSPSVEEEKYTVTPAPRRALLDSPGTRSSSSINDPPFSVSPLTSPPARTRYPTRDYTRSISPLVPSADLLFSDSHGYRLSQYNQRHLNRIAGSTKKLASAQDLRYVPYLKTNSSQIENSRCLI